MQWNVLSLKRETYKVIREQQPHVLFFQETRQVMSNTPAYNYINRVRNPDNPREGGGVAIGIEKNLIYRDLTPTIPDALQDLEMVFVQIVHSSFELYALNVYVSNYQQKKSLLKPLE